MDHHFLTDVSVPVNANLALRLSNLEEKRTSRDARRPPALEPKKLGSLSADHPCRLVLRHQLRSLHKEATALHRIGSTLRAIAGKPRTTATARLSGCSKTPARATAAQR